MIFGGGPVAQASSLCSGPCPSPHQTLFQEKAVMSPIPELLPLDDYNAALLANVHPPKWQNPQPAPSYHLVVVGAGTAGLVAAAGAAGLGARVALVERHLM